MAQTSTLESRLQEHLLLIRRTVGWSAAELGQRIGKERQTINYLESKKYELKKTVYLAIRKVLDDEIAASPDDTKMLQVLLEVLVDHPDNYSDQERREVLNKANMIAPSILAKSATRSEVSNDFENTRQSGILGIGVKALTIAIPIAGGIIAGIAGSKKTINKNND